MQHKKHLIVVTFLILIILDVLFWYQILFAKNDSSLYFLDVGQGDSSLLNIGGGNKNSVQILIDGGRDYKVLEELGKVLLNTDRYIDIVLITHPDLDHFGGIINVLKTYKVGLVIYNGLERNIKSWEALTYYIKENKIPTLVLGGGDIVRYKNSNLKVFSPTPKLLNGKNINNTALVLKFNDPRFTALFTGDIGFDVEKYLTNKFKDSLQSDILKVAHHGSKYASNLEFLKMVNPKIALIGVGKNSYGHPTKEILNRLSSLGITTYRTDQHKSIKIYNKEDQLGVALFSSFVQ